MYRIKKMTGGFRCLMRQRIADIALLGVGLTSWLGSPMAAVEPPQGSAASSAALAAESLADALADFARQTGLQLVYVSGDVNGVACKRAPEGLSARETLMRLLEGTGLTFEFINERTVRIFRRDTPTPARTSQADSPADVSSATTATNNNAVANGRDSVINKKQGFLKWIAGLFTVCGPLISASPAFCQSAANENPSANAAGDQLEEVVVTAERRVSDLQKTAQSISVRSGDELENQGRYSLAQILEDIPGITGGAAITINNAHGSGSDATASGLTIRGIQSNKGVGGDVASVAPAAAIYVDGVYEGVGGGYDIDRVEVLRGPQGTLYGRSATAGLVAIHTTDPQLTELGGNAQVEFGNYSLQHYGAAVNVPIVDDVLAVRVAGNHYERDGYWSADGGALANTDGKIKLLYEPSDSLSILLGYALQNNTTHNGGQTLTLSGPDTYRYTPSPVAPGKNEFRQYWALVNWDLGGATLTYQPAYRTWKSHALFYTRPPLSPTYDALVDIPKDDFHTEELRLASNPGAKIPWRIGALYYENELANVHRLINWPSGTLNYNSVVPDKSTRALGFFGDATYSFTPSWRLIGGLRYDKTDVEVKQTYTSSSLVTQSIPNSTDDGTRSFSNITYKARVEHDLSDENLLYASVSTGFSPGDVTMTTGATGNPVVLELEAETLTAYEIGSKSRFLNNTLQVNGAIYYSDYGAYQTSVNITPTGTPTFAIISTPVKVYGGELEVLYRLTSRDRLGLDLAYANSRYVDKDKTRVSTGPGTTATFANFVVQDEVPGVVPFTASLSYEHTMTLPGSSTLVLHGDVRSSSSYDGAALTPAQVAAGLSPYVRVDDAVVGNLSATWASPNGNYSLTGYVRNVGESDYKTNVYVGSRSTISAEPYDPRTYGVVLNARF